MAITNDTVYQTSNGPRTATEMAKELVNVGWNGAGEITQVYARTTGGAVSPGGSSSAPSSTTSTNPSTSSNPALPPGTQIANTTAANQLLSQAQQAAYQAYLNARLNLETDAQAFSQAQQAFTNKISEAGLTGQYQGQPTMAGRQQEADIAAQVAGLTGVYTPPGAGAGGAPTSSALQQYQPGTVIRSADTGQFGVVGPNGTLQTGNAVGQQVYDAIQRPGSIYTVPEAAFTQGTTGGTVAGVGTPTLAAINQQAQLSGQYNGAPTEAARQANNATALSYLTLISNLKGPQDYGSYLRTLGSTPGGIRDLVASAAGQYTPSSGASTGVAPTPASLGGLVGNAATGAASTSYGDYMNAANALPAGNQISADAWNSYTTGQKQFLLGMYQSRGDNPQDVQDLYAQSLPKYGYTGTGSVKLS